MTADLATLLVLTPVVPGLAALLIPLFSARPNAREAVTLLAAGILFAIVLTLLGEVTQGARPAVNLVEILPGLALGLAIEPLGMLFAVIASGLWIVNSIYSIGYMRGNDEPRQTPYYVCFAVAIASTMGIAFSANLFTLFIFYEILTLSTYPLVSHKQNDEAKQGGRTYLVILLGTSMVLLLPAIIWTWVAAGTVEFTPGGILGGKVSDPVLGVLLALYAFGVGKAALMPFHRWLPAAMVAPTPVSALLHAVAVVKAGVFTVVKVIVYVFGIETLAASGYSGWLVYIAGFTVIAASIVALNQDNLKRLLAYSTVSQLSYVIIAAALFTPLAVVGAAVHIAVHAVSKITLFFAAGSIYTAAHLTEISQMRGIGRRMPWTMTAFAVGAVSMIGLPPTAGFLGKWFILQGAMTIEQWFVVAVIVASTVLNAMYFLPIIVTAFLREPAPAAGAAAAGAAHEHGEAPLTIVIALTITASLVVLMFLFPDLPLGLAEAMVEEGAGLPDAGAALPAADVPGEGASQ